MATKRKLPFGYRMEFGEIVIHPLEAVMVQKIFQQYASGASYKELVDTLRNQDVPYNPGKIWNKNMVNRAGRSSSRWNCTTIPAKNVLARLLQ